MAEDWPLATTSLRERMAAAVADPVVPGRVQKAVDRFATHRAASLAELHDPDGLRRAARARKAELLADLPNVLDRLADRAAALGVQVHWAATDAEARRIITGLAGGARVVKSKSMATEEIALNEALEATGARVVETDLGEWIIQLAEQHPSHIIAPAVHHDRYSILEVFERVAGAHGVEAEPTALNAFARERLRAEFLAAEVGITGVNFAVADTGSLVLVTNEGNGRLTTSLPPVHIAVLGMERVVQTWDDLDLFLTLLVRSATGQRLSSYTSVVTGPRRPGEPDGPDELHLVVLDNGRTDLLGTEFQEMLACVRCGACLNACPVYRQTGGHAYGWVYSGPMGAVLTPLLAAEQTDHAAEVAGASTLCGACMAACPVEIPLQDLLLSLRRQKAERAGRVERTGWRTWSTAWSDPRRYEASTKAVAWGRGLGRHANLLPGASRWTAGRTAPVPARTRFRDRWRAEHGADGVAERWPERPPSPQPDRPGPTTAPNTPGAAGPSHRSARSMSHRPDADPSPPGPHAHEAAHPGPGTVVDGRAEHPLGALGRHLEQDATQPDAGSPSNPDEPGRRAHPPASGDRRAMAATEGAATPSVGQASDLLPSPSPEGARHRTDGGPDTDRGGVLGQAATNLARGAPPNLAHPLPVLDEPRPRIRSSRVDPHDLVGSFAAMARSAGATVHLVDGPDVPADLLAELVDRHGVERIVHTADPEAVRAAALLAALDPRAGHEDRTTTEQADLGITSAVAGIAATGSIALDSTVAGDRTTSLLPRVHLCVLPAGRIVAHPEDLFLRYDAQPDALPSNLVLVTGPSRTGDIEQLLTIGVHGPTALELVIATTGG